MTQTTEYLLPPATETVSQWRGWTLKTEPRCYVTDNHSYRIGFLATRHTDPPEPYLFACKRRLYQGHQASFMPDLVGQALTRHVRRKRLRDDDSNEAACWLGLFVGREPSMGTCHVFDPRTVNNKSDRRAVPHTKRSSVSVEVFDVDVDWGCLLGDMVSGRADPESPEIAETRPTTLKTYGVTP